MAAKKETKAKAPKQDVALSILDLPSDRVGVLTGLRTPLINIYNKTRGNEEKRKLLKETLERVLKEL